MLRKILRPNKKENFVGLGEKASTRKRALIRFEALFIFFFFRYNAGYIVPSLMRSFALELGSKSRSAPPGRGTENRILPHYNEAGVPFRWWMKSAATFLYER